MSSLNSCDLNIDLKLGMQTKSNKSTNNTNTRITSKRFLYLRVFTSTKQKFERIAYNLSLGRFKLYLIVYTIFQ